MRILVLDEEFPYPLNTGKRIRSINLLKQLAVRHQLHYLAYGREQSVSFRVLKHCAMNPIAVLHRKPRKSGMGFYARLLGNLTSKEPYIVTSHYSRAYQDAVDNACERLKPDLIICEWTPYARFVQDITLATKIVVAHNVESRIWQRYYENENQRLKKWYIGKQWHKVAKFEKSALGWVDGATAVSKTEAAELSSFHEGLPVEVIDNGVDLEYFSVPEADEPSQQLVFSGAMDWRPNQDAAIYFVEQIWPLLRKREPKVESVFVGRNPPPHIVALGRIDGVTVTGTVDDIRPFVRKGAMFIVPLRIGGGSRLKILEALAMGKAVVSTTMGAEGLDVIDGETILLADEPERFVENIQRVLSDRSLAQRLGEAGRKLVEEQYGWAALADRLESFLLKLVNTRALVRQDWKVTTATQFG